GGRPGDGGRAAGAAGRRDHGRGRRGWRTRWGDAYFRRPRRVGGAVEGFSDPRGYLAPGAGRAIGVADGGWWPAQSARQDGSMLIEETVTYLEMTAAEQLRPGRLAPAPVEMVKLDQTAASLLRRTYARIAAPLNWQSRRTWSDAQ